MKQENLNDRFGKEKGTFLVVLLSFFASLVSIVLEIVCIDYFNSGVIDKYSLPIGITAISLTVIYFLITVLCKIKEKQTLYRSFLIGYVLILFLLVLLFVLEQSGFFYVVSSVESFQRYLKSSGGWMPAVYVILQYLQVVVLPIPGFLSTVAGVALFGPYKTTILSLIGILLGSLTGFFIGRKLGYKAVGWMVGKENLDKWLKKIKGKDNFILTAMFLLPLFPDDILCFVAGLSSMTTSYFIVMILIARILSVTATCFSFKFIPFNTWWGILIWGVLIVFLIVAFTFVYKNLDAVNDWFNRKFHKKK